MQIRDRVKDFRRCKAGELLPHPGNWRTHPTQQVDALKGVLAEVGIAGALIAYETPHGLQLIDGHCRADVSPETEWPVIVLDVSEAEANKLLATLDPLAAMAEADAGKLDELLRTFETGSQPLADMLEKLAEEAGVIPKDVAESSGKADSQTLSERFGVPPFSVLDARQGYWQDRKRAWLSLGIQSELGRGGADASPGGSDRPAAKLGSDGRTVRGDGKGREINAADQD